MVRFKDTFTEFAEFEDSLIDVVMFNGWFISVFDLRAPDLGRDVDD